MLHDLHSRPFSDGSKPKPLRSSSSSGGNGEAADGNKVGLLPSKGWRERNFRFLNDVLIPHLLAPRQPRGAGALLGELSLNQTGVTWLGHAGFLLQLGGKNILVDPVWALWLGPAKRYSHPSLVARDLPYI